MEGEIKNFKTKAKIKNFLNGILVIFALVGA
jgi:hypothetical protein